MGHRDPLTSRETCHLCGGTGKRTDPGGNLVRSHSPAYECNGCRGTRYRYYPDRADYGKTRAEKRAGCGW